MIASGLLTIQRPLNKVTLISGPVRTFDFVSLTTYPANVRVYAWISHQVFFVQFSFVISRLETTWTWRVSLCFVNLGTVLKNSSPEKFLFTWQIKRSGIVAIKFVASRIYFSSGVEAYVTYHRQPGLNDWTMKWNETTENNPEGVWPWLVPRHLLSFVGDQGIG